MHEPPLMQIVAPLNNELHPTLQRIEIASSFQIPSFQIVGLPSPEVAEARERIRAAIDSSGFEFPRRRIVVNLSPASIRKRGTGIDLAMALAILASQEKTSPHLAACGELGLDGTIKPIGQIMRAVFSAWRSGIPALLVPAENRFLALRYVELLRTARLFQGNPPRILAPKTLGDAWKLVANQDLSKEDPLPPGPVSESRESPLNLLPLTPSLERILCIAAAGFHHLLLLGPKGAGKTHSLEWLIELMPSSDARSQIDQILLKELNEAFDPETTAPSENPILSVPTRRIGSQSRPAALLGGAFASWVRPGEFSLAHGGILIADELPEWPRDSRETLREPLESGQIVLTRSSGAVLLPARFMLAATGNLCGCGGWPKNLPIPSRESPGDIGISICHCSDGERSRYLNRISGPVLDRIDLVRVFSGSTASGTLPIPDLLARLRDRVLGARRGLESRLGSPPGLVPPHVLEEFLHKNPKWKDSVDRSGATSLRARHKLLRVALTLAQWDGADSPGTAHFYEASCYRPGRFGLRE